LTRSARQRQGDRGDITALREELRAERDSVELLRESMAALELQLHDPGWQRLAAAANLEFTAEGLCRLREICRLYAVKSPLIKRAVELRAAYVWGEGVQVSARATGKSADAGEQDVNAVIQEFLAGRGNVRCLTGQQARERLERRLAVDGEIPILLTSDPATGRVRARIFSADEIVDIRCDPDDAERPWYYLRRRAVTSWDAAGTPVMSTEERWHPHLDHRPLLRPAAFGPVPVDWSSPILHVAVNGLPGWHRGLPDVYAAVDWAKAYKEFLEQWALLMKSLSRYAWRAKAPAAARAATRSALAAAPPVDRHDPTRPLATGATVSLSPGAELEAISKTGATIDADSGRPLATMAASAVSLPVTMLLADPGQTGARATAETLDRPTELCMSLRRGLHAAVIRRICEHVIAESVRAPRGALRGTITVIDGEEAVTLDGGTDQTVDITWPDLDEADPAATVKSIVDASSTGVMPPEIVLRLLLAALGVADPDGIIGELIDDDGEFQWPSTPAGGGAGLAALAALAQGQDPAAAGGGPMGAPADTPAEPDDPPAGEPAS
jgi:hypothetical protein